VHNELKTKPDNKRKLQNVRLMSNEALHLLLTDDNKSEHVFFKHALNYIDASIKLTSMPGGIELMQYLENDQNPLPDILFLDVNMPFKNGKECLSAIRANARFKDVAVVMYSTSDAQKDTDDTFALGADLYVRKPTGKEDLSEILNAVLALYKQGKMKNRSRSGYVLSTQHTR